MRLKGKVALVTGGGSGLGREGSLLFAEEGARVLVTDIDGVRATETVQGITRAGGAADALKADVTDENDMVQATQAAVDLYGRLDILFHNPGFPGPPLGTHPCDITLDDWQRGLTLNLTGPFLACKHAARHMRETGGGSIVITSSAAGLAVIDGSTAYGAAKGGTNALVRNLAVELGRHNIRVNAICPLHGMSANFFLPPGHEVLRTSTEEGAGPWDPGKWPMPLKAPRPPQLRDNANVALFLASDESAYQTGWVIPTTDGGTLAMNRMQLADLPVELLD